MAQPRRRIARRSRARCLWRIPRSRCRRRIARRGIAGRGRRIARLRCRRRIPVIRRRRARVIRSRVIRPIAVIGRSKRTPDKRPGDHTRCNGSAPTPPTSPLNLLEGWRSRVFDRQRVDHGQRRRNADE